MKKLTGLAGAGLAILIACGVLVAIKANNMQDTRAGIMEAPYTKPEDNPLTAMVAGSQQSAEQSAAASSGQVAEAPQDHAHDHEKASADAAPVSQPDKLAVLAKGEHDLVFGEASAPVTVVEYFSLSCPHCQEFYQNEKAKLAPYIEGGKIQLRMRHFPHNASGLAATRLVRCLPAERQKEFVDVLFKMQKKWAHTESFEANLKNIAQIGGVSEADYTACMANKALEEEIVAGVNKAGSALEIRGIPAFFVGNTPLSGVASAERLKPLIEEALVEAGKK